MESTADHLRTAAILEIKELNSRYNFAIDEVDADAWAACFTKTGVFNALIDGHRPRGTDELKSFVPIVNDFFGTMNHLTTNEIITFEGQTARQKCYLLFFTKKNAETVGTICIYHDWLEREDGRWGYSRRDVEVKAKFTELRE